MTINWKNYNSKNSYDEYLTPEKSLRKEAKVISKILNSYSVKDLERIEQNCQSTISSRGTVSYTHLTLPTMMSV